MGWEFAGMPNLGLRLSTVAAVGLGAGVATSYLQQALPASVDFVANSGAVWTLVAFLLALWVATRRGAAPVAGLLSLLGEVLGYYAVASPIRHVATSPSERVLWIVAALVIGPFAGWLAGQARWGRPAGRTAAAGVMSGLVAGEGMYALYRLHHPGQGWSEVAAAVISLAFGAGLLGTSWRSRMAGLPTAVLAAAGIYVAYIAV